MNKYEDIKQRMMQQMIIPNYTRVWEDDEENRRKLEAIAKQLTPKKEPKPNLLLLLESQMVELL